MLPNIPILIATALIPMILGYIWFHPKMFGGETWYNVAKLTGEDRSEVSTAKLLSTLLFNFFIAFGLYNQCIHSMGALAMVGADSELLRTGVGAAFMAEYGQNHLSFGHGVIHAIFPTTAFIIIPVLAYVTIFEKKNFKYFMVYTGYWALSLMLMGGILCQWGTTPV